MGIIRTKAVELSVVPAIAFKQKLTSGGAGIKIIRLDMDAIAVATMDKRSGEAIPYGKFDEKLFPSEAFDEAINLTSGLPYSNRSNIKVDISNQPDIVEEVVQPEQSTESINMIDSDEYVAIVDRYCDEQGKINYVLMNKDFIQFAANSKTVSTMVADKSLTEEILLFIIKNRAAFIANKKESLDDQSVAALIETLDEIETRSAFKELKKHINKQLARK